MSIKSMTWAFQQPLSGNEKVVLLALADFANDEGECWPSMPVIAEKSYLSVRTVQRIILSLADQQYLRFERRNADNGRSNSNMYRLSVMGDNLSPYGDTAVTGEGDTVVTTYEPSIRTVIEPNNRRGSRVPENFFPDATSCRLADENAIGLTTELINSFLDYWRGVPGAKGLKLDWQGTFRNQIRHIARQKPNATRPKSNSIASGFNAINARIEREERELAALENSA